MKQRRNLKQEETKIIALLCQENCSTHVSAAWEKTMEYFQTKDVLEGSHHVSIMQSIYKEGDRNYETLQSVATKNHIGERTFYRYREKYIDCFYYFYNLISKK